MSHAARPGPEPTRPLYALRRFRPSVIEWICLAGGLFLTLHYAWLMDDAYVYFRYVDNLLFLDHGLVFNRGEYVEGNSSTLWTLLLCALRATRLDYWLLVRGIGVVCFISFWGLIIAHDRRFSPPGAPRVNLPLVCLSFNYSILCYFTSGTESPLTLVISAAYVCFIARPRGAGLEVLLALSPLVRPELAVPLLAALVWKGARDRRIPWRMVAILVATSGGWLIFRIWYYADLFPNTFHLKDTADVRQGWAYLHDAFAPYHYYAMFPAVIALGIVGAKGATSFLSERAAMLGLASLYAIYVVRIGGDARHFRYLLFPVVLALCSLSGLVETALMRWPGPRRAAGLVVGLLLAGWTTSLYPRQLVRHPRHLEQRPAIVEKIADAAHHRNHRRLPSIGPWDGGAAIELLPAYERARTEGGPIRHEDVIAGRICWELYEAFDRRCIQSFGLCEPFLARTVMTSDRPAHKRGLIPLGDDIVAVHRWWGRPPEPGMFRAAVEAGRAAPWIEANLATIEVIERKVYNRHRFFENLSLAFTFPEKIRPDTTPEGR